MGIYGVYRVSIVQKQGQNGVLNVQNSSFVYKIYLVQL